MKCVVMERRNVKKKVIIQMLKIQTVMTASTKFISSVLKYLSVIYHKVKILF